MYFDYCLLFCGNYREEFTLDLLGSSVRPQDEHGSRHVGDLVTGANCTGVPKTMITSRCINKSIEDRTSTDDMINDTEAKIRGLIRQDGNH